MADIEEALESATVIKADSSVDYVIDKDLRTVAIPTRGMVIGVEGDKDVNRVRFSMPRMYKGTDLSKMQCKVVYINANNEVGTYAVDDIAADGDQLAFTWLVSSLASAYQGTVQFGVHIYTDGKVYNSTIATAECLVGIEDTALSDIDGESLLTQVLDAISAAEVSKSAADSAADKANAAAANADQATADAKSAKLGADTAAGAANSAASAAGTAKADADTAAEAANKAAENANLAAETAKSSAKANASVWMDYDEDGNLCIYESEGDE